MKDKRTKEQILKLLDHAIEQEERLSEKIKSLETDLANCRKKAENPRQELTEEAMSASKVSFRIDYYRTSDEGPLKGIIEHLPSRQNKAFEGEGNLVIPHFMGRFLSEESGKGIDKDNPVDEKSETATLPAENVQVTQILEKVVLHKEHAAAGDSRKVQQLKAGFADQSQGTRKQSRADSLPSQKKPVYNESIMPEAVASSTMQQMKTATQMPQISENTTADATPHFRSKLLERLLEEQRQKFKLQ